MMGTMNLTRSQPASSPTALFHEFFSMNLDEGSSPFLTPSARLWSSKLTLKTSFLAAIILSAAFALSWTPYIAFSYFLLLFVYFFAGIPSLIEAVEDLLDFDVNIDVLMTFAAFSSVFIGGSFEGALLLVLFSLSGSMEDFVVEKAKGSLNTLHKLAPTRATVFDKKGHPYERSIQDIVIGTPILIRAGEVVPLDGLVIEGTSSVNLVHLTGENLPVRKSPGDQVPAGAQNLEGTLTLSVTHTSADSTLRKIIQLVTQAQESRPRLQRWFDRFSRAYALIIISLSLFFSLILPFVFNIAYLGFEGSVYRSLAFLIAASPCALILALPIAYLSALSVCAKKGILLKGGVILDALAQCSMIAFDKTGTLTTGQLATDEVIPLHDNTTLLNATELLSIAFALEKNAVHPIAHAINRLAKEKNLTAPPLTEFALIPGYGVTALVLFKGKQYPVYMGSFDYIKNETSPSKAAEIEKIFNQLREQGKIIAVLRIEKDLFVFAFQDTIRRGMKETIQRLKSAKLWKLLMLTGDHEVNAKAIADSLGIDHFFANLRPEDKLDHVTRLSKTNGLAMVGDGINDAPALSRASVGICMGKVGSGMAIAAADVVLLHDDLDQLDWLMVKARQTQKIVKENLAIALLAIACATIPALAGWIPLWVAVVLHEGGTVLVGLNALRLLR